MSARPVRDPAVTVLQHDRAGQHDGTDAIQRPEPLLLYPPGYGVGDPRDQIPGNLGATGVGEVAGNVARSYALGLRAEHGIIKVGQPPRVLRHDQLREGLARCRGTVTRTSPTLVRCLQYPLGEADQRAPPARPGQLPMPWT